MTYSASREDDSVRTDLFFGRAPAIHFGSYCRASNYSAHLFLASFPVGECLLSKFADECPHQFYLFPVRSLLGYCNL